MPCSSGAPSVQRRLAVIVYEAMLLFGVLFIAGWIFGTLLQQRHALYLREALQYWLFFVIGIYFVWFWSHGGQTLAMKTWHVRLVTADGGPVPVLRAAARYALSWMWVLPGLLIASLTHAKGWMLVLIPVANILIWGGLSLLDPTRQFFHDRLAGTRIVGVPVRKK
jgi:uncharacterized RDD family membrane protein YckC